jgi:pimeloyl-ACP methyl ester carboxylesterase
MHPFYLKEITTKDGLIHQGIFFRPKNPGKKALLWVHGLTSKFYGNSLVREILAEECEKQGWGLAFFNNRGHDIVADAHKIDAQKSSGYSHVTIGSGNEVFESCVFDIESAVSFLASEGFSEIILIGNSTGANKVCYYGATQKDPRISGIVLSGPMSDRYSSGYTPEVYEKYKAFMLEKISGGKGDMLVDGYDFFPLTPNRWVSLYTEGTAEDVFNYTDSQNTLTQFSQIKTPLLILLGEKDEHAHVPIEEIRKSFDTHTQSLRYQSTVVMGANHGFDGKEKEVATLITDWVNRG